MNKKHLFSFFALLLLLGSCRFVAMKMFGITKPHVENEVSVRKAALKHGLDTSAIFTVSAEDYKRTIKMISGIPDAAVFDSAGSYIEYRQTDSSCNAGLFGFLPALKRGGSYNHSGKTTLAAELKTLRTLKGEPVAAGIEGKAERRRAGPQQQRGAEPARQRDAGGDAVGAEA